jgi:hypothetical protein
MSVVEFSKLRKGDRIANRATGEGAEVTYVNDREFGYRLDCGADGRCSKDRASAFVFGDDAAKRDAQR